VERGNARIVNLIVGMGSISYFWRQGFGCAERSESSKSDGFQLRRKQMPRLTTFFFCIRKKEVASTPAIGVAGLKQAQHSEHVIEHCNRDQDQGRPADRNKLPTGYGHGSCMRALLCIDAAGM
jgi:hypothetical protein